MKNDDETLKINSTVRPFLVPFVSIILQNQFVLCLLSLTRGKANFKQFCAYVSLGLFNCNTINAGLSPGQGWQVVNGMSFATSMDELLPLERILLKIFYKFV